MNSISSLFDKYLKDKILDEVFCFVPFVRLSLINHSIIMTFFGYLNLFNGKKIFFLMEPLPNIKISNISTEEMVKYLKSYTNEVRQSVFMETSIYKYMSTDFENDKNEENVVTLIHNYILANFIYENFKLDFKKCNEKNIIVSMGEIPLASNKKQKLTIFMDKKIVFLAKNKKDYQKYRKKILVDIHEMIIFHSIYISLINLINKTKKNKNDYNKLKILCEYISKYNKKYKISFSKELEKNIINFKESKSYQLLLSGAGIIGKLLKEFFSE